jgi:hypothetical protein
MKSLFDFNHCLPVTPLCDSRHIFPFLYKVQLVLQEEVSHEHRNRNRKSS